MTINRQSVYRVLVGIPAQRPSGVVLAAALTVVLSLVFTATHLAFHTSRLDLISSGNRYKQLDEAYKREFEDLPDRVIVVIRSRNPEQAKAFATALARRWGTDPNIENVLYRINTDFLKNKALLYLSPDDLVALRQRLQEHQGLLEGLAASPTLPNLLALINREMTTTLVDHVFTGFLEEDEKKKQPPDLSLLLATLREMNQWLDGAPAYQSPWATFFGKEADALSQDGFLWSDDKQLLFVLANPRAETGNFNRFKRAIHRIRADVAQLRNAYPTVEVGITGRAVLESDEMALAQRDTTIATVVSVIGVTLLYVVLFRGVARPLLAFATLAIAVCWALGFTTLTVGHLNILTIVFMPMLIGLGIDYGSYFIARYEEERATGKGVRHSLGQTLVATGPGIATTALTTALTFATLIFTGFKGVAELGFIGGSGILLAALATFTVFPALLVLDERRRHGRRARPGKVRQGARTGYLERAYRYPWAALAASALLVGLSVLALKRVGSDFNLLHIQARGTESVVWEQRIFESTRQSVLFGEIVAKSPEEVSRKAAALTVLPSVTKVESIASVIPEDQERKLPLIRDLQPLLADISFQKGEAQSVDLDALRSILGRIAFKMEEDGEPARDAEEAAFRQQMREVRRLIERFEGSIRWMQKAEALQALSAFQGQLGRDLEEKLAILKGNPRAEPVTIEDLPSELRARYMGRTGQYRLFVFPAEDVWEFQPLARFVGDLRSVDPDALGVPITNLEFTRGIKAAYEKAGLYAFLGIALLTLLTFRAAWPTLLALTPLAVGGMWTLGFMGLFRVKFNVANLIVLPLVMAPAVESGIMIVSRYREESKRSQRPLPLPDSTGRAVAFSALSTIVGFGSLMISSHWGIRSIGLLLTFGVASVLVASLTVLPSLLAILSSARGETARLPREQGEPFAVAHPAIAGLPARGPALGDRPVLIQKPDLREAVRDGATIGAGGRGADAWGDRS